MACKPSDFKNSAIPLQSIHLPGFQTKLPSTVYPSTSAWHPTGTEGPLQRNGITNLAAKQLAACTMLARAKKHAQDMITVARVRSTGAAVQTLGNSQRILLPVRHSPLKSALVLSNIRESAPTEQCKDKQWQNMSSHAQLRKAQAAVAQTRQRRDIPTNC